MMPQRPLCFVLMPFGVKKEPATGLDIDFDRVYDEAIRPSIEAAGLEPIRADEERTGGIIHKAMFERLVLCDYAVADLTTANANVFYELGVRHAVRPATTLTLFAKEQSPPFDVGYLRSVPYSLGDNNRFGSSEAARLKLDLARRLEDLKQLHVQGDVTDSPVFQLLDGYSPPDIARLKTDVFRERASYAADVKNDLARARSNRDAEQLARIRASLEPIAEVEAGVLVDLFLSLRAVNDWEGMVALHAQLPVALRRVVMLREQLGFALNRLGRRDEAQEELESVLAQGGPSSETYGLLGRVYKDRWADARRSDNQSLARGFLDLAIDTYVKGFEVDLRDAYPGINAVTLLDIKGDDAALTLGRDLLPVVRYAVELRLRSGKPDYWDHATLLELAVLADEDDARLHSVLSTALAHVRESWEPETTANNLRLICDAREARGRDVTGLRGVIKELESCGPTSA